MTLFYFWATFMLSTTSVIHGRVGRFADDEAIKMTIQSKDGDVIDCYDIYQQPALKHPLFKDHKLKLNPNKTMNELLGPSTSQVNQTWTMSGTCPEGTVPIRRTSQTNNISGFSFPFAQLVQMNVAGSQQTEAVVDYSTRGPYLGATATVTIWDPHVEPNEYSNTFIMVGGVEPNKMRHGTNVPFINLNYQIAFGWIVSPAYYHDSLPRLHLYLTLNGGDTNCMNYECNLFVHTNNTITLGGSVSPISTMGGPTSHIDIEIHRDLDDIKWWVSYNHVAIGYFPSEAVDRFYYGSLNMRGAIVLNTKPRGKHTSTQMGSGRFPIEGDKKCAQFRDFASIINSGQIVVDPPSNSIITKPNCYKYMAMTKFHSTFLFGGPGGADCDS